MDDTIQKSQYMRILIADALASPEKGDWKNNFGIEEMCTMFAELRKEMHCFGKMYGR